MGGGERKKKREEMRDEEKEGEEKYTTKISARDKYVLGEQECRESSPTDGKIVIRPERLESMPPSRSFTATGKRKPKSFDKSVTLYS